MKYKITIGEAIDNRSGWDFTSKYVAPSGLSCELNYSIDGSNSCDITYADFHKWAIVVGLEKFWYHEECGLLNNKINTLKQSDLLAIRSAKENWHLKNPDTTISNANDNYFHVLLLSWIEHWTSFAIEQCQNPIIKIEKS